MGTALAVVGPIVGTLLGVLLGAMVEPLRLRFLSVARRRDALADRCADLVRSSREVIDRLEEYETVFDLAAEHGDPAAGRGRMRELMNGARLAHHGVDQASALIELTGPDSLGSAAEALRVAGKRLMLDLDKSRVEYRDDLAGFEDSLARFVDEAKGHVR